MLLFCGASESNVCARSTNRQDFVQRLVPVCSSFLPLFVRDALDHSVTFARADFCNRTAPVATIPGTSHHSATPSCQTILGKPNSPPAHSKPRQTRGAL